MLERRSRHPVHRFLREAFFTLYNPVKRWYWYLVRPTTAGVKVLAFHQEKLLLVRIGYSHQRWSFPGGAIDPGETPEEAAKRELFEESGATASRLTEFVSVYSEREYKKDTVHYFTGEVLDTHLVIDDQEIVDAGWFPLDALPEPRVPRVDEMLARYQEWQKLQEHT